MRDLSSLTGKKLLTVSSPESLYSNSLREAKLEYRSLVRRWHPDFSKDPMAADVLAHIVFLYHRAREKILEGNWFEPIEKIEQEEPGLKKFRLHDKSIRTFENLTTHLFELGTMYIGTSSVIFEVHDEFEDLYRRARRQIKSLPFKNQDMAAEMSKNLPQITDEFRTEDALAMVLHKTPDQLLMADVCKHLGGVVTPIEHLGWILNVLYNIACYLEWADITHNAIAPETMFISPLRHSGMLLGGWWYSTEVGAQLHAVPERSLQFIPPDILMNRRADTRSDLELIKSIGRELLGDPLGAQLQFDTTLPNSLVQALLLPSYGSATDDYLSWKYDVLPCSFGPPKFMKLELESADLYKEN